MPVWPGAAPGLLNACLDAALADARRWVSGPGRDGATMDLLTGQQSGTKLRPWQQAQNPSPRHIDTRTQVCAPIVM